MRKNHGLLIQARERAEQARILIIKCPASSMPTFNRVVELGRELDLLGISDQPSQEEQYIITALFSVKEPGEMEASLGCFLAGLKEAGATVIGVKPELLMVPE